MGYAVGTDRNVWTAAEEQYSEPFMGGLEAMCAGWDLNPRQAT